MASRRFLELLGEQAETHIGKSAGYAGRDNPDTWANFRNAEALGLTPLQGCMVRLSDKFVRAANLMRDPSNEQVGETLRDTLIDLGNYAMIAVCLLDEDAKGREQPIWPDADWISALKHLLTGTTLSGPSHEVTYLVEPGDAQFHDQGFRCDDWAPHAHTSRGIEFAGPPRTHAEWLRLNL